MLKLDRMEIDERTIEQFLYHEAELMDNHRFEEWASLMTDDIIYWVPSNRDDYDPDEFVSIIYDDRDRLQDRIDRLNSGAAWAQEPRSRMRRVVSNIRVLPNPEDPEIIVSSNFVLVEMRRGMQNTYAASQIHKLRLHDEGLKISFKKVMLVNNDEPIHNLSFLV